MTNLEAVKAELEAIARDESKTRDEKAEILKEIRDILNDLLSELFI